MSYNELSKEQLAGRLLELNEEYAAIKSRGLQLDMSRGKPCPEQLQLSMPLLDALNSSSDVIAEDGTDCRNYGGFDGIPEAKRLMAAILEVPEKDVFVGGPNSLNLMHDLLGFCYLHPLPGCALPWGKQKRVKFLCPSPGYDRHFFAAKHFGIELVMVPMTPEGPDMDRVEELVTDPAVKGMWCVPKYSNPQGYVYSAETVRRLAGLRPAASDFRIFCDNAYAIHDLYPEQAPVLPNIMNAFREAGSEDLLFLFCSFAKISFGGGGMAAIGASANNLEFIREHFSLQMICSDKVNQLRHVRYFNDIHGLRAHMAKQAEILRPKFELVQRIFEEQLEGLEIASWTHPQGGYFISLDTLNGCAKRTVALCKEAGVMMTPAGATFPDGNDPDDKNIRIAPSYPGLDELRQAAELLTLCVKIASAETLLDQMTEEKELLPRHARAV